MDNEHTRLADGRTVTREELVPIVYEDLRRIAARFFQREDSRQTLQPTALVHEAWLRLADQNVAEWSSKAHFLAIAAHTMRRVLVDVARARRTEKRGGALNRVTLGEPIDERPLEVDVIDLDAALERLAKISPRYVQIVELRFFAGLTGDQIAEALQVSRTIVTHEWKKAKAWLLVYLDESED